jgi:hypothetical protein
MKKRSDLCSLLFTWLLQADNLTYGNHKDSFLLQLEAGPLDDEAYLPQESSRYSGFLPHAVSIPAAATKSGCCISARACW